MKQTAYFVLLDRETRNQLLDTEIEEDAFEFVRQYVTAYGEGVTLHWALFREDGRETDDSAILVAEGYQLADMASRRNTPVTSPP